MTWTTGEPVTWMYQPPGGYGYVLPIPATVVRETPKGVRIAAIDKAGKVRFRNVKPKNLRRRTNLGRRPVPHPAPDKGSS